MAYATVGGPALLLLLGFSSLYASEPVVADGAPAGLDARHRISMPPTSPAPYPFYRAPLVGVLKGYRALTSSARVLPCSMYPSCSSFALTAFRTYSPFKAAILTSDRLMRCGKDRQRYAVSWIDGYPLLLDPVPGTTSARRDDVADPEPDESPGALAAPGETCVGETDVRAYRFAWELQAKGEFADAIREYRRMLSYYPGSTRRADAQRNIFDCQRLAGQHAEAIISGRHLLVDLPLDEHDAQDLRLQMAWSAVELDAHRQARELIGPLSPEHLDAEQYERAAGLEGYILAKEAKWPEAEALFERLSRGKEAGSVATECLRVATEAEHRSRKSSGLASGLSIIPGLGYLYAGYPRSALSTFLINAVFAWATYEAFHQGRPGLGATLGTLGLTWYGGNIYGAVATAYRRNEQTQRKLELRIRVALGH